MEEFSLRDRVTVVTGGGQSLGLAICRSLRRAGAQMVIAEVNDQTGPDAAEELEGTFVHTDVTDPASVRDMVEMVLDEHGRIDVLVNNAGIVHNIPSEEVPDEEWLAVISVNLTGVFWCCREVGRRCSSGAQAPSSISLRCQAASRTIPTAPGCLQRLQSRGYHPYEEPGRGMGLSRRQGQQRFAGLHKDAPDGAWHVQERVVRGVALLDAARTPRRAA
jgi:NAD(P)-dependent dehydrogenase (short-subunit alcohol dehydrogenase family)